MNHNERLLKLEALRKELATQDETLDRACERMANASSVKRAPFDASELGEIERAAELSPKNEDTSPPVMGGIRC